MILSNGQTVREGYGSIKKRKAEGEKAKKNHYGKLITNGSGEMKNGERKNDGLEKSIYCSCCV